MIDSNEQFLILIGKRIRREREKMGLSQEELGDRVDMHRTYVGMVERGEKNITVFNLRRFAQAIGVEVKYLVDF